MTKRIIWTADIDISSEAIQEAREEDKAADLNYLDGASDDEVIRYMTEDNYNLLEDEVLNLSTPIKNPILVIGDLGLWHGRRQGYKILHVKTVGDILKMDTADYYQTFYADAHNVRCEDPHHDGTNYYLFRELIVDEDSDAADKLLDAIYSGKDYTTLMRRYTRSILPYVADVYGWPCAARRKKAV